MKATIQLYSDKGFFGPSITTNFRMVADLSKAVVEAIETLPSEIEGVRVIEWTRIDIQVSRE